MTKLTELQTFALALFNAMFKDVDPKRLNDLDPVVSLVDEPTVQDDDGPPVKDADELFTEPETLIELTVKERNGTLYVCFGNGLEIPFSQARRRSSKLLQPPPEVEEINIVVEEEVEGYAWMNRFTFEAPDTREEDETGCWRESIEKLTEELRSYLTRS